MIIAIDLDGTLCTIDHRLHYIQSEPKNWGAFYAACVDDVEVPALIRVTGALWFTGHQIEIWSGRSDEVRDQTEKWLASKGVRYHTLKMRKAGDFRVDHLVKAEWFDALPVPARPILAFEDRQQVVDMWRSRGVLCCQVAPGNF